MALVYLCICAFLYLNFGVFVYLRTVYNYGMATANWRTAILDREDIGHIAMLQISLNKIQNLC